MAKIVFCGLTRKWAMSEIVERTYGTPLMVLVRVYGENKAELNQFITQRNVSKQNVHASEQQVEDLKGKLARANGNESNLWDRVCRLRVAHAGIVSDYKW